MVSELWYAKLSALTATQKAGRPGVEGSHYLGGSNLVAHHAAPLFGILVPVVKRAPCIVGCMFGVENS